MPLPFTVTGRYSLKSHTVNLELTVNASAVLLTHRAILYIQETPQAVRAFLSVSSPPWKTVS